MITPAELHRYFKVRYIPTDVEVDLLNGDVRYKVTGSGFPGYRIAPDGDRFLVTRGAIVYPWPFPVRLDEVEPLPNGRGLWSPDAWEHTRTLAPTYEGSWRQYADQQKAA